MKFKLPNTIVVSVSFEIFLLQFVNQGIAQTIIYHGFTLLDPMQPASTEQAWLIVEGEKIRETGSGDLPLDSHSNHWRVVEMTGTIALPGFIDAHGHITCGPMKITLAENGPAISMESMAEVTR